MRFFILNQECRELYVRNYPCALLTRHSIRRRVVFYLFGSFVDEEIPVISGLLNGGLDEGQSTRIRDVSLEMSRGGLLDHHRS